MRVLTPTSEFLAKSHALKSQDCSQNFASTKKHIAVIAMYCRLLMAFLLLRLWAYVLSVKAAYRLRKEVTSAYVDLKSLCRSCWQPISPSMP